MIINADDFGKCHSRNMAIQHAMACGWCNRASLIVNMDGFDEAARMFVGEGEICFHLNLGEGCPLTEEIKETYLCDLNGMFKRMTNPRLHLKMALRSDVRRWIRKEIEMQMLKFRDCGFKSEHVDSHFFTHAELDVACELVSAMKKYGFRTIRTLSGHFIDNRLRSAKWITRQYYSYVNRLYRNAGLVVEPWAGCPLEYLETCPQSECVEVYVHPDLIDGVCFDLAYSYFGQIKRMEEVFRELQFGDKRSR